MMTGLWSRSCPERTLRSVLVTAFCGDELMSDFTAMY